MTKGLIFWGCAVITNIAGAVFGALAVNELVLKGKEE